MQKKLNAIKMSQPKCLEFKTPLTSVALYHKSNPMSNELRLHFYHRKCYSITFVRKRAFPATTRGIILNHQKERLGRKKVKTSQIEFRMIDKKY